MKMFFKKFRLISIFFIKVGKKSAKSIIFVPTFKRYIYEIQI